MGYLSAMLPLFSVISALGLGISGIFLAKGRLRWAFLKFCATTFHWQFCWMVLFAWGQPEYADLICRIGYTGIIFLPLFCYETVNAYLDIKPRDSKVITALCLGFLVCLWSNDLFIEGAHLHWFGYYPKAGVLHPFYLAMVAYLFVRNSIRLTQFHRRAKGRIKKCLVKFFLLASMFYSLSGLDYVLNYPDLMPGFRLYPFGVFFITMGVFLFAIAHFVTINATLEKRVRQKTQQLENSIAALREAASTKKKFITNITHELRTPLTLIRGWTEFMLDERTDPLPQSLVAILNMMQVQTLSLTHKINELLKASRYDAGMAQLTLTPMDMDAFVFEIVSSFQGLAKGRQLAINYQNRCQRTDIYMDGEKMRDILNNLIRNAFKFTEKGEIRVTLDQENDSHLILTVEDTGVGIAPGVIQGIFKRFEQGDGSKTRRYEGTGLGLAIVKESVNILKGKIQVKSRLGEGTCFTLELPCNLEELSPKSVIKNDKSPKTWEGPPGPTKDLARIDNQELVEIDRSDASQPMGKNIRRIDSPNPRGTIVIAEDSSGIQEFLGRALGHYTLYLTSDGKSAWDIIQTVQPDLLISDIMMPELSGFELLRKVRAHSQLTSLPVIIITSLSDHVDRIKSLQLGADEFLTKPFHHLELQARVKNVIGLHRLERERARREQLETFLMVLASAIESKDPYTGGHVERVANYARDLSRKLKLSPDKVHEIYMGTIVHDVGKIGIKDEVLNKKGKLTPEEFEHIKEHPVIGKRLLSQLEIAPVAVNIAYFHQEKWDGTGYPTGAANINIPLEARIAAIADFWDAITSQRPYRRAMPLLKALETIKSERGKSLDPTLLDLFLDNKDKLYLKYLPPQARNDLELSVPTDEAV